jgi:hypothetical protein
VRNKDDMDSSMFVMRALAGPMTVVIAAMATMTVFTPIVLYVIARWRAHRDPWVDKQLGLKFALHYFAITAFQLALGAGTMLVWALMSDAPSDFKGAFYRTAFGLLAPAGIVLAVHISMLKRTNDDQLDGVRRLFLGYNLIVTGLLGFVALIIAFQALFAKGSSGELGRLAGAMILVYGTSWALLGYKFGRIVVGGAANGGGPLAGVVTPPVTSSAAAGGGLPSLGGGAYPPIDPNDQK